MTLTTSTTLPTHERRSPDTRQLLDELLGNRLSIEALVNRAAEMHTFIEEQFHPSPQQVKRLRDCHRTVVGFVDNSISPMVTDDLKRQVSEFIDGIKELSPAGKRHVKDGLFRPDGLDRVWRDNVMKKEGGGETWCGL